MFSLSECTSCDVQLVCVILLAMRRRVRIDSYVPYFMVRRLTVQPFLSYLHHSLVLGLTPRPLIPKYSIIHTCIVYKTRCEIISFVILEECIDGNVHSTASAWPRCSSRAFNMEIWTSGEGRQRKRRTSLSFLELARPKRKRERCI
jgi:hypothetical protein